LEDIQVQDEIKVGVYLCHCGENIADVVNVGKVREAISKLPHVHVARDYVYMCSDPGQGLITDDIKELGINRVVVASCSPRMHEPTFQKVLSFAGLNPYLLEMANIREHCSWPHINEPELATAKAIDIVRAAVSKAALLTPLETTKLEVTKAALVIGGGIAGIRAALDIADAGFKVYLVEKNPSIGGRMAQLDKTFPTLDCSQCILTPLMVDVSRHPNIELLTYSEVDSVEGGPGTFKVKIRKKARYIDEAKCTGCALCEEGCPVILPSEFNEGLGKRKAIFVPFPQAVPKKYVIDKREERLCKAACKDICPLHTNVLGYLKLIAEGDFKQAYKLIRETNPLPASVGRVCYAPCEEACNRGQIDESLAIRDLKRFAADQVNIEELEVPTITRTDKKVAIVGSGPAGLAAANDLTLKGHNVTIFEAFPEPGGMLRVGIPEYRLPKEILRKEIGYIQKLGVEIRTGVQIGKDISLEKLRKEYDAIFIGTGAHGEIRLGVKGENLSGVMEGIRFLRAANLGEKVSVGKKVAVIGGGNTAVDCAQTAKRLGAEEVKIVYRRSREEMPASTEEVAAVEEEGILIEFLTTPTRFLSKNGKLASMECVRMKLGEPDASGRPRPIPIKGSEFTTPVDTVIAALGQAPETEFAKEVGISLSKKNAIEIDSKTGATNVEGIFAGGDVVTGPAFVIDAIAAGQRAARSIDLYLKGEPLEVAEEEKEPEKLSAEEVEERKKRFPSQKRLKLRRAPVEERIKNFQEVALGYTPEEAVEEALRCLAGQIEGCIECRECERRCGPKAIDFEQQEQIIEVEVGNIVVATGFELYDVARYIPEYGLGKYKNVLTGMHFERMASASGPTGGKIVRPSDGKQPESVAIILCVGSRDQNHLSYCCEIGCVAGLKHAYYVTSQIPSAMVYICYTDIRAYGKGYEEFYERMRAESHVNFIHGKPSEIHEDENHSLYFNVFDLNTDKLLEVKTDLVVLETGLIPNPTADELRKKLKIAAGPDEFFLELHPKLRPVETPMDGILICGTAQGPKDIPSTVAQAGAAASKAIGSMARGFIESSPYIASLNESLCSGCGVCEGLCFYNAISKTERDNKVVAAIDAARCKGCGVCVAACPAGCIDIAGWKNDQLMDMVTAIFAK
jgi:heterodisulfide reductase subunit A